jgi:hypothetical protein
MWVFIDHDLGILDNIGNEIASGRYVMSSPKKHEIQSLIEMLSISNSMGATIQLVLVVAALCAVFSTLFWWIR